MAKNVVNPGINATLAVANLAYYKPLAASASKPHQNISKLFKIRSICEKYGSFLKLWVASLGDPLPLHSDQRLLNFYFVPVAQQSTELQKGFHGPYPPRKLLIFLEHFGRRRYRASKCDKHWKHSVCLLFKSICALPISTKKSRQDPSRFIWLSIQERQLIKTSRYQTDSITVLAPPLLQSQWMNNWCALSSIWNFFCKPK